MKRIHKGITLKGDIHTYIYAQTHDSIDVFVTHFIPALWWLSVISTKHLFVSDVN